MVDFLETARRLSAQGEPFVMATVVWRKAPSSGQAGAKAIIRVGGRMEGWLGGACSEDVVLREARQALEEGSPRLVLLGAERPGGLATGDGIVSLPMGCASEGSLGIYLEPVLPTPRLVAIGRTPVVDALAGTARALGWQAVVVDEGASPEAHPEADVVLSSLDLSAAGPVGGPSLVVVASMGHDDEGALEAALASDAAYVGLVASARRAQSVFDILRQRGVKEEDIARVHAPAGLDLGHLATREIAVAIVAEILSLREGAMFPPGPSVAAEVSQEETEEAIDPVCGMTVATSGARHRTTHDGTEYFFCCAGCQIAFEKDPAAYGAD
jgi:xanthine dehydrogenase accessory factor